MTGHVTCIVLKYPYDGPQVVPFERQIQEAYMSEVIDRLLEGIRFVLEWGVWLVNWSVGKIMAMFGLPFMTLPLWKQIVFVIAVLAILYIGYRFITQMLDAFLNIFRAIIKFITTFVERVPDILIAAAIALVCAWVVTEVRADWLP